MKLHSAVACPSSSCKFSHHYPENEIITQESTILKELQPMLPALPIAEAWRFQICWFFNPLLSQRCIKKMAEVSSSPSIFDQQRFHQATLFCFYSLGKSLILYHLVHDDYCHGQLCDLIRMGKVAQHWGKKPV